jgi:hypothetical protein
VCLYSSHTLRDVLNGLLEPKPFFKIVAQRCSLLRCLIFASSFSKFQVEFQNTVYPCHSFILALFSDVTSEMFASDPDQSRWSKGVAAAWEGSTPEAVQVYLKLTYSNVYSKFHAFLPMEGVLETMELAHKLDNEVVKKVGELLEQSSKTRNNSKDAHCVNLCREPLLAANQKNPIN